MEESYITFDREKLKQVVHYICATVEPARLGTTRLHKILYFADMLTFLSTHRPLTGVDYLKQKFGPAARHLSAIVAELEREGALRVETRDYYGFAKKDYIALAPAPRIADNSNAALINDVIAFVCDRSATEISELSHNAAWEAVDFGERIPYASAFGLIPVEVTDRERQQAKADALRLKPQIEAESRVEAG